MKRIPSLDGIRAIAILFVLISHFTSDFRTRDRLDFGTLGVRIFFVLSGFLITRLLLKEAGAPGGINLKRFYFRRTLRIFPPFYFYLFAMLMLSAAGWSMLTWKGAIPSLTYTSNYWSVVRESYFTTSHTWSLSTEEQFYLIWPALMLLLAPRKLMLAVVAVMVASPLLRILTFAHYGNGPWLAYLHLNADHLGTGCLLALVKPRLHANASYRAVLRSPLCAAVPLLALLLSAQTTHPSFHKTLIPSLLNLSIAFCIDWAITNYDGVVGRVLNSRPLVWTGLLSYSIYLWQQPFTHLLTRHPPLLLSGPWKILANPAVSVLCIAACACFSYFVVERPALRWRDRIEGKNLEEEVSLPVAV